MPTTRQEVLDAFQAAVDLAASYFLDAGGEGEDGEAWEDIDPDIDELRNATILALEEVDVLT